MSSKKDKFLESARKFVVKGQLDRAIKDYEQVVALDPSDMKHRQKLAELLVRINRQDAAIKEYEVIGRFYAENSYYLKAIAVYKQIQKLNPADISIALKLGEYNKKQGLSGNALAEYGAAYNHYVKAGNVEESFKILDKMVEVDPENPTILLQYAEARFTAGFKDEAYEDFCRLVSQLLKRGDKTSSDRICERVGLLFPDKADFTLKMLEAQIDSGNSSQAIPRLQEIIKKNSLNRAAWELLTRAYNISGDVKSLHAAYRYILHFFPDELVPRERLIETAIKGKDISGATEMIKVHMPAFISKKEFQTPERLCIALLELVPDDPAIIQALKTLYEAGGEKDKLQQLNAREIAQPDVSQPKSEQPIASSLPESSSAAEPDTDPVETRIEQDEPFPVPAGLETNVVEDLVEADSESLWEDELDLTQIEDVASGEAAPLTVLEEKAEPSDPEPSDEPEIIEIEESVPDIIIEEEKEGELVWLDEMPLGEHLGTGDDLLFGEDDLPSFSEFSSALDDLFPGEVKIEPKIESNSKYHPVELMSAFRKGLDEQVDQSDSETHYNLGIAYKEMGLFDDAVHELQTAGSDRHRAVDCLTLQGICHREKGDNLAAMEAFKGAMAMKNATIEEIASATYELALVFESEGRNSEAQSLYRDVRQLIPDFRDVGEKLIQGGNKE